MTKEEKSLLLKDLCARLTYGVILDYSFIADNGKRIHTQRPLTYRNIGTVALDEWHTNEEIFKPYLRPMSSMTEEEKKELWELLRKLGMASDVKRLDWLIAHHFDIRNLIEKGLALEAPEGMYNIKEK